MIDVNFEPLPELWGDIKSFSVFEVTEIPLTHGLLLPYTKGSVTSKDGTTIGYRQMGQGEPVILVHGGMQAAQHFMRLATALSSDFTVTVPDRRGRGLSGTYGDHYDIQRDVEDMDSLLGKTGAQAVFGLSSGAVISLASALALPQIRKLAIYEPPLSVNHSYSATWVTQFDREVAQGKLGSAMVSVMHGTGATSLFSKIPRFLITPLLNLAMNGEGDAKGDDVPIKALVPTMHYDAQLIADMGESIDQFSAISADVLLLGGSKSAPFLKIALDRLAAILPHVQRIEFPGFDHLAASDDGHPERVAEELRRFFG